MTVIFVILHLLALFLFFPGLFVTIPAHIFYVTIVPKKEKDKYASSSNAIV